MRDGRLSQAQTAVVAGDLAVEEDLKAGLAQGGDGEREQEPVLKAAATQGDRAQAGVSGDALTYFNCHSRYSAMKAERYLIHRERQQIREALH